ncbi:MAG TPA: hypothetical protein VG758_13075 [Hyphomicrobiaceae bacterium]|jgi:hypothetical protein|nr:hypothetical protein [Hyphomicrobiaceae bacterium]
MREIFRLLGAFVVAVAVTHCLGGLDEVSAQAPAKQIKLTAQQVESFIAAQRKMATAKADAEFEAIAKEHGFAGVDEHDDVEANILLLMDGIDPRTRAFSEPPVQIMRRIEEVKADKTMPEADRKQALEELTQALKTAKPIEFPGNVELVRKYYDQLQAVLE